MREQRAAPGVEGAMSRRTAPIAIRFASSRDLPSLTTLFDAYRVFYGLESNREAAGAFLSERLARDESVILLALLGSSDARTEEVVGFAQLYRAFSSLSLGCVILLNDLFVVPSARRCGVGAQLLDAATAYAFRVGALSVHLETRPDNAPALELYRAKGFTADDAYMHLTLPIHSHGVAWTAGAPGSAA
jgi:GNAT superfamily N-acetyltransferase